MSGHCHIHLGVIQRSRGQTALNRLAYSSKTAFNDGIRRADYSVLLDEQCGTVVLLPLGAPSEFADEGNFTLAVAFRDTRVNAQEGRTIDFSLPREIPRRCWLLAAAYAMTPFVELGMAVRIDVENKRASDGGMHPHVHAYVAQRLLEADGFGLKCRWWDRYFLRNGGRYARAIIAARLTAACNQLGIAAWVDPRTNEARGMGTPMPRLASAEFREFGRSGRSHKVTALLRQRTGRTRTNDANLDGGNRLESPIRAPADAGASLRLVNKLASLADQTGCRVVSEGAAGLTILSPSGIGFGFDGRGFHFEEIDAPTAGCVLSLISKLNWPALVVEGTPAFADAIALAGTRVGIAMINRSPGEEALRKIARHGVEQLTAAASEYDPLGKIVASVPAAPILPDLEMMPEPAPKAEKPKDTDLFDRYLARQEIGVAKLNVSAESSQPVSSNPSVSIRSKADRPRPRR